MAAAQGEKSASAEDATGAQVANTMASRTRIAMARCIRFTHDADAVVLAERARLPAVERVEADL
jgi:hypothetical protein